MKTLILAVLLWRPAMAQGVTPDGVCGPAGASFTVTRDRTQHPMPAPEDGKALVYVIGSSRFPGWGFWGTLAVDGKWVGAVSHR